MQLRVSSPGHRLKEEDIDRIQRDLEKLDRRLSKIKEVYVECRVNNRDGSAGGYNVVLEVEYRRNRVVATGEDRDMRTAVINAREDALRQINDRSRRGHSSFSKGR
jgi:ribosome-associated translation inhibitor RaiA